MQLLFAQYLYIYIKQVFTSDEAPWRPMLHCSESTAHRAGRGGFAESPSGRKWRGGAADTTRLGCSRTRLSTRISIKYHPTSTGRAPATTGRTSCREDTRQVRLAEGPASRSIHMHLAQRPTGHKAIARSLHRVLAGLPQDESRPRTMSRLPQAATGLVPTTNRVPLPTPAGRHGSSPDLRTESHCRL